ncbi:hypothetical protein FRC12_013344 [Ceratobasidium sp. 428]|nr:hypothetical protein FRC12_013344 [Ceratobasidium sp. 428]
MVSAEALDKAAQAGENPTSFQKFFRVFDDRRFSGLREDETPKEFYIAFTTTLLWKDRDSFFTLCQRGLLPGSTLLLVIALKLALSDSDEETSYETLMRLKDLAFRAYLAGSHQERQILQFACMPIIEKEKPEDYELDYLINAEDSQRVSRAYFDLLPRWRRDKSEAKNMPVGFMTGLTGFALNMSVVDSSATVQGQIAALGISIQLLWLLFEHKGQILVVDHPHFRTYGLIVLVLIMLVYSEIHPSATLTTQS